ncbi:hypothetical protein PO878_10945 [Iamia majanohamensis]|uniref:Mce-associated membrane protein n=1 Tax=Iamia majanohamensis TaxID=467976 RepID=A0AAE9Y2L5_9ACTN|nr:hypothetical protein [Iamia majanohamensis]WCO65015.1 hypothetical protein PO878_10945 [Iamia majanohamensis]
MSPTRTRPATDDRPAPPGSRRARQAREERSATGGADPTDAVEADDGPDRRPGEGSGGGPAPRNRRAGRPVPRAATAWKVLAVVGIVGTVGFGLAWRTAESRAVTEDGLSPAAVEMRAAGRDFAIALTNFDADTIDADFDRILAAADGQFAEEAERFYDEEVRADLRDARATSRSEISEIYVQGFDGDRGSVFAVVDQTVANNLSPQPVTDTLRVDIGLQRSGADWKVVEVDVLDAPIPAQAAQPGAPGDDGAGEVAPPTTAGPSGGG